MSDRLTDEQLAAIAAFTDEYVAAMDGRESRTWQDAANGLVLLLAEVRRLRAVDRKPSAAEWEGTLAVFREGWPPTVGTTWERMFWEAGYRIALDPIGRR